MRTRLLFAFALLSGSLFAQRNDDISKQVATAADTALSPAQLCQASPAVCAVSTESSNSYASEGSSDRETLLAKPIPHPYVLLGPSLMGMGYARLAYRAEAGIDVESTHFLLHALGAYDDGHKTNDGDQPNANGHDRYLEGAAYYRLTVDRLRGLFLGAGYRWNQLSTTNYTKGAGRYEWGLGYDLFLRSCARCYRDFSMRLGMDWITEGKDWQNGVHGPEIQLTFPAPIENRHWFWTDRVDLFSFHQTVTEPGNLPLLKSQLSNTGFSVSCQFGVIYRF
jgi:hypothetical protein